MKALSVSELNNYIKNIYNSDYFLSNVHVKGELSNFKMSGGNYYFSIKDEKGSSIDCILFANIAFNLIHKFQSGENVIIEGRVSFYEKAGRTSLIVRNIEADGIGQYYIELERLKKKLDAEGLFDPKHKRPIPEYISKIGVVTSKTGAVIEDIKRTVWENNLHTEIVLYPAKVQGDGASATIIKGIRELNNSNVEVIIVARGGGSTEDLFCFNDEELARTIYNSNIPIIAAIGHQIDYSIADMVADATVATPTAAGELASYNYNDAIDRLTEINNGMLNIINVKIDDYNEKISLYQNNLSILSPKSKIKKQKEILDTKEALLKEYISRKIDTIKNKYDMYVSSLSSCNAIEKLKMGYAYITDKNDKKIVSSKKIKKGDLLNIRLHDGKVRAKTI